MRIPDVIFSAGFDRALAWTMLHSIWQATLIALLTGLLLFCLRRHSARLRYTVVNLALLTVLLTSVGTFTYYFKPARNVIAQAVNNRRTAAVATPAPSAVTPNLVAPTVVRIASKVGLKGDLRSSFRAYISARLPLIVSIWFLGMAVFLCRLLGGISRIQYLRHGKNFPADPYWLELMDKLVHRSGCLTGIQLLESALVRSPLTIGHLKPVILFPIGLINRLSEQEVEAILAHELAHILRHDYLFNLLQSLVEAIFYFHPAIWWLSTQVRQERESACDDQAIALVGDKINYAKALVSIQEMAFYPQHPALAFAGPKRNQLLMRIQRLFSPPTTKFNIMEKWIATGLVLCSLVALAFGQHISTHINQKKQSHTSTFKRHTQSVDSSSATISFAPTSGLWEADFNGDSVCMTFSSKTKENHWVNGECFSSKNFTGLNFTPGETVFHLIRPAGTMTMTGKIEDKAGYGRFEFKPSETYRTALTEGGVKDADDELLIHCFFANFPANYLEFLKKSGYSKVSKDELLQLAVFRLDEMAVRGYLDMASSLGQKEVPLHQLVELKVANVGPENVAQLAKAGYPDLDINVVSELALQNVTPAYIDSMNAAGFGKLSAEDLVSAKIQGLDFNFVKQYQNLGFVKLSFDDVMSAKIQGLDADFLKDCQAMGFKNLSFDEAMSAKIQGLDADFVKQCQAMGFKNLSFDEIISAKIQGIDADFVKQCEALGFKNLSFDDVMSAKIQGIDADFVRECQKMGFTNLSFEEIMTAKIHGLDADFVKQYQSTGGKPNFDEVISAKIHGITPAYIKECQDMGLGKLDADDIVAMKVHGIDAAAIRQFQQMDIGPLNLGNLLQIRIHGVTLEMVKNFRDLHFENLTVEDLISAKIHQVTPEYIKEANQKGYRFPTVKEYADLKVRGYNRGKKSE